AGAGINMDLDTAGLAVGDEPAAYLLRAYERGPHLVRTAADRQDRAAHPFEGNAECLGHRRVAPGTEVMGGADEAGGFFGVDGVVGVVRVGFSVIGGEWPALIRPRGFNLRDP